MRTGEKGKALIKKYEGLRLSAYKCPSGIWTIGWGHTAGVKQGQTITKQQAEDIFTNDLKIYENHVNKLGRDFTQSQFDALVSFCYNCGSGSLNTLCKNRNNSQIAEAILLYNKDAYKRVQPGLVTKRNEERTLFLSETPISKTEPKLPYDVVTTTSLNIRKGPSVSSALIRTVPANTVLRVWAICTNENRKWGKNNSEYFCLDYCKLR